MADILVVNNQEIIRQLSCDALSRVGHHVTTADNGQEALRLCKQHKFDLLILDYQMPDMDGWEMLERLRGRMRIVLHISDYDNVNVIRQGLEAGAIGVIAKNGDIAIFRKKIETFLSM